jgi:hypothetical protein
MDIVKEILTHFDEIEALLIRATGLIVISIFCFVYIRSHIKDVDRKAQKYKRRNRRKRISTTKRKKIETTDVNAIT